MAIKILSQFYVGGNQFLLQLEGLSSDTKPTDPFVAEGSQFKESDTDAVWVKNTTWTLSKNGQMKNLPAVSAADNGKVLKVDDGVWSIGEDETGGSGSGSGGASSWNNLTDKPFYEEEVPGYEYEMPDSPDAPYTEASLVIEDGGGSMTCPVKMYRVAEPLTAQQLLGADTEIVIGSDSDTQTIHIVDDEEPGNDEARIIEVTGIGRGVAGNSPLLVVADEDVSNFSITIGSVTLSTLAINAGTYLLFIDLSQIQEGMTMVVNSLSKDDAEVVHQLAGKFVFPQTAAGDILQADANNHIAAVPFIVPTEQDVGKIVTIDNNGHFVLEDKDFPVTITEDNGTYSSDKSTSEIYAASQSKKNVYAVMDSTGLKIPLAICSNRNYALFSLVSASSTNVTADSVVMGSSTITVTSYIITASKNE
ncbi:MAG: hypothetical protein IKN72_03620 [Clostridia bacterium]|nr:hypothetical protein [Clostridia bacterium]